MAVPLLRFAPDPFDSPAGATELREALHARQLRLVEAPADGHCFWHVILDAARERLGNVETAHDLVDLFGAWLQQPEVLGEVERSWSLWCDLEAHAEHSPRRFLRGGRRQPSQADKVAAYCRSLKDATGWRQMEPVVPLVCTWLNMELHVLYSSRPESPEVIVPSEELASLTGTGAPVRVHALYHDVAGSEHYDRLLPDPGLVRPPPPLSPSPRCQEIAAAVHRCLADLQRLGSHKVSEMSAPDLRALLLARQQFRSLDTALARFDSPDRTVQEIDQEISALQDERAHVLRQQAIARELRQQLRRRGASPTAKQPAKRKRGNA